MIYCQSRAVLTPPDQSDLRIHQRCGTKGRMKPKHVYRHCVAVLLISLHMFSVNSLCVFAGSVCVWPLEVRPGEGRVSRKRGRNRFGTGPLTPLGCKADIGVSALMYALVWPLEWEGTWKKDGLLPHKAQTVKWVTFTVGHCWCFFEALVIFRKFCIAK